MDRNRHEYEFKKYKFYRKPIKKKGPEVKHTKTSLARILKANPLLKKCDIKTEDPIPDVNLKRQLPKPKVPILIRQLSKPRISNLVGNGPYLKPKTTTLSGMSTSSDDFAVTMLSSTLKSPENDVFFQFPSPKNTQQSDKIKENYNGIQKNINGANGQRKSLSSQYLEKKKKEIAAIMKRRPMCNNKRRSRSLEDFKIAGYCHRIEEEPAPQLTKSQSIQNLSDSENRSRTNDVISYEEHIDEDKENINVELVDANSYEDLLIA